MDYHGDKILNGGKLRAPDWANSSVHEMIEFLRYSELGWRHPDQHWTAHRVQTHILEVYLRRIDLMR